MKSEEWRVKLTEGRGTSSVSAYEGAATFP